MPYRRIAGPAVEPVTLEEMKFQARIDGNDEDALVTHYIEAAREYCEKVQGKAYIEQTFEYIMSAEPERIIKMPVSPLRSVESIVFTDEDGTETTVSSADYVVDTYSWPGRILLKDDKEWPDIEYPVFGGVKITFKAGYGTSPEDCPKPVRQAILLLAADWYKNRENTAESNRSTTLLEIPMSVNRLLQLDREIPV